MTTPLFLLRCVQIGLQISELDLLTIGTVNDMYSEMDMDDYPFAGVDPQTGKLQEGIEAQTEQAVKNIAAILEAAGTDFSKVVKTTCFLYDMKDFAAFNAIYEKAFISKPARSCVAVKELPAHFLCEIEVIAEV